MGFDLYGIKPKNKKGEYFRNNVWWWRPLWEYISKTCDDILTSDDRVAGGFNDGCRISKDKAEKIAKRLSKLIKDGDTKEWEVTRAKTLDMLPDEKCDLCDGTGIRKDMEVNDGCNKCHGKGTVRPLITWYPFSVDNVKEFIEFAENSGGFKIW
jgi:hypothetical protein